MAKRTTEPFECLDAEQIGGLIKRARPGKINAKIAWMRLVGRYLFVEIGAEIGMDRRTVARRYDDTIRRMALVHKCPLDSAKSDTMTRQGDIDVYSISELLPNNEPDSTTTDSAGCACSQCNLCVRKWVTKRP